VTVCRFNPRASMATMIPEPRRHSKPCLIRFSTVRSSARRGSSAHPLRGKLITNKCRQRTGDRDRRLNKSREAVSTDACTSVANRANGDNRRAYSPRWRATSTAYDHCASASTVVVSCFVCLCYGDGWPAILITRSESLASAGSMRASVITWILQ